MSDHTIPAILGTVGSLVALLIVSYAINQGTNLQHNVSQQSIDQNAPNHLCPLKNFEYYDKVEGYPNHGQTCYFNSLVQLLVNIPELRNHDNLTWLKQPPTRDVIKQWTKDSTQNSLPINIQHCAFEALQLFWANLAKTMKKDELDDFQRLFQINIEKSFSVRIKEHPEHQEYKEYPVLTQHGTPAHTQEPYFPVILDTTGKEKSLQQLFMNFVQSSFHTQRQYTKQDKRYITLFREALNERVDLTTYMKIIPPLPKYLIIQIRPFFDENTKRFTFLRIHIDECLQIEDTQYTCISMIVHFGNLETQKHYNKQGKQFFGFQTGGHYKNYSIRQKKNGEPKWYCLNDRETRRLTTLKKVLADIKRQHGKCVGALYVQNEPSQSQIV